MQGTWTDESERYSLTLFLNNFFDKTYLMLSSGSGAGDYSVPGEPRTWGVRAGYRF